MSTEEPLMGEEPQPLHGIIHVSCKYLQELLFLHEGFDIVDVSRNKAYPDVIDVQVKYGEVPILPEGARLPLITPIYRQEIRDGRKWVSLEALRVHE